MPVHKAPALLDRTALTLGTNTRRVRRAAGLTQEEAAKRMRAGTGWLARLEAGHGNPTIESMAKLCSGLDVDITDLLSAPPLPAPRARAPRGRRA